MSAVERLHRAIQSLVDEDYGVWGGVNKNIRDAAAAFNELHLEPQVLIPEDAE